MRRWLLFSLALARLDAAPVTALVFNADGTVLVAATGNKVSWLNPESGETTDSLEADGMRVTSIAFQPGGRLLAVGGGIPGERGEVRLLDTQHKKWLPSLSAHSDVITSISFDPKGTRLVIASADHTATVYRIEDDHPQLVKHVTLKGHSAPVTAAAFTPDGTQVITTSVDRSLKLWSAADGQLQRSLGQHTDAVHCLALRPGTPVTCASGGDERNVRVWQPVIGRMVRIVRHHQGSVLALVFAPHGDSLFSAGQEGIVREIDAGSDTVLREWPVSQDWIYSLAISPDGQTLASGDWLGRVHTLKLAVKPAR